MASATLPLTPAASSSKLTPPSQPCALGPDLGSSKSKLTLAYMTPEFPHPVVKRVPLVGGMDDPERPNTSLQQDSIFDFVAFCALKGGRLVVGRQSVPRDCTIPLKTILLHFSGAASRSTVEGLPGGRELFRGWDTGLITAQMEESVLLEHFGLLYRQANLQARALRRTIVDIALTHPSWLFPDEGAGVFEVLANCFTHLVRRAVGKKVNTCSWLHPTSSRRSSTSVKKMKRRPSVTSSGGNPATKRARRQRTGSRTKKGNSNNQVFSARPEEGAEPQPQIEPPETAVLGLA